MWPGSSRSAASFTFDLDADEVWLGEISDASNRPCLVSQGEYEIRRGLHEVLAWLKANTLEATFFVPGKVAERFPDSVEAVLEAGHEVGHHGYGHVAPAKMATVEEQRRDIDDGLRSLSKFGIRPQGYRAPSWDVSAQTFAILAEFDFVYSSNLMADIVPYRLADGIIEIPVHWTLDDAAYLWFSQESFGRTMMSNTDILEIWGPEAAGIRERHGLVVHTFHPSFYGMDMGIDEARKYRSPRQVVDLTSRASPLQGRVVASDVHKSLAIYCNSFR